MDGKYGRVFTENDVKRIVQKLGGPYDLSELLDEMEKETPFKFPADEPVFVLRAQDRLALAMVRNYMISCRARGCSQDHQDDAEQAYRSFNTWRDKNPEKVKDPD